MQDVMETHTGNAPCIDCGKDTEPSDEDGKPLFAEFDLYLVRDEVWAEAGMDGWAAGWLCTPCLSKRLGRGLRDEDYLLQAAGVNPDGSLRMSAHPDYGLHPSIGLAGNRAERRAALRKLGLS